MIGIAGRDDPDVPETFAAMPQVESVQTLTRPYKLAAREFRPGGSVINAGFDVTIGGEALAVMAGPCSIEDEDHIVRSAFAVKDAGANILRGGAYKPRTSPYAFRGLGEAGLKHLALAGRLAGMPVVTELMSVRDLDCVARYADIIQIGARNMQNFTLLDEVGTLDKPVLLKRGLSATIEEWLLAAEYILARGNQNVILCERGIRTFETAYRNTFDVNAIPLARELSHLPVIGDPSHGTGRMSLVAPVAKAAVAAGADGLMIEVHNDPEHALSDGAQSLTFENFTSMMREVSVVARAVGRSLPGVLAYAG
jgi:3-deoxy-7-phosphoheptulonate synthase